MENTTESSNILLLCLGLNCNKKNARNLKISELRQMFSVYGTLKKIMIFSKKTILKAFLEYETKEGAMKAVAALHEKFVDSYGKARLYCSALQTLKYSNKFLDYWNAETGLGSTKSTRSLSKKTEFSYSRRDSLDSRRSFYKIRSEKGSQNGKKMSTVLKPSTFKMNCNAFDSPKSKKSIVLSKGSSFMKMQNKENCENLSLFNNKTKASNVVLVSNLKNIFKTAQEIFNLFSSFGDITKVLFMSNLQKALIEYKGLESSRNCIENIDNLVIFNTKLKVNYSKYKEINLKKNNKSENSINFNQVYVPTQKNNRISGGIQSGIQDISEDVIVRMQKNKDLKPIDIYLFLENTSKPEKIKILKDQNRSDEISFRLSFKNIQSAIFLVSKFHCHKLKNHEMKIQFA